MLLKFLCSSYAGTTVLRSFKHLIFFGVPSTSLEGGDRVVVPWYQRGLHESAPIKISSLDDFGIPRTNF